MTRPLYLPLHRITLTDEIEQAEAEMIRNKAHKRARFDINTQPAPFDPRDASLRDTQPMVYPDDLLMAVDDPVIRADVLAERTDHMPLQTMAVYEPQDKPLHPALRMARDAGCWVFDLFSPDSANEKPMTAERRAAMLADRQTIIAVLRFLAIVGIAGVCAGSVIINLAQWAAS